ncbi:telomere-protecting terminal protein Tpg [Streptomyces actuosus]|uniref:telomere-protecting terminal protein Tpg n=1 Tax=Streptomyces TaxID=1883 RepID=UPI003D2914CD
MSVIELSSSAAGQRCRANTTGITIETRARFGYTAPIGSTDDPRIRRLTVHLPADYARRLFDAQAQGANETQLRGIVAEGLRLGRLRGPISLSRMCRSKVRPPRACCLRPAAGRRSHVERVGDARLRDGRPEGRGGGPQLERVLHRRRLARDLGGGRRTGRTPSGLGPRAVAGGVPDGHRAEREEKNSVAIASNESFGGWTKTFTDPRLCAAIVDRLPFNGTIIETGTDSYRLASNRARTQAPAKAS